MTDINNLAQNDTLADSDQFAIWSGANGATRRVAASSVAAYIESKISNGYATQYAQQTADGFNVAVSPPVDGASVFMILTATVPLTTGVIELPAPTTLIDGQELLVSCTPAIASIFIDVNGALGSVGAPTSLAAGSFFRMRYDMPENRWYRAG